MNKDGEYMKTQLAFIANFMWRESLRNINAQLTASEAREFNSNDYYYLTTIYYLGKPRFSQVAQALKLTKPAVSAIVRKLAGLGLVEKKQSPDDGRVFFAVVTEKGKQIVEGDEELYGRLETLIRSSLQTKEHQTMMEELLSAMMMELGKLTRGEKTEESGI